MLNKCRTDHGLPSWRSGKESTRQCRRCRKTRVWSLGREDSLKEKMAAHSSILAWKIPWIEEPGGLQSMGLQKIGHDWACTHITDNNVVILSGEQWRGSAIHIHVPILPQSALPSRLSHNIQQSSLCYTVGPCCIPGNLNLTVGYIFLIVNRFSWLFLDCHVPRVVPGTVIYII